MDQRDTAELHHCVLGKIFHISPEHMFADFSYSNVKRMLRYAKLVCDRFIEYTVDSVTMGKKVRRARAHGHIFCS